MPVSPKEVAATVDALLQEQDRFDFARLLHSLDLLDGTPHPDIPAITQLRCTCPEAEAIVQHAIAYADTLGLLRRYPLRSAVLADAMSALRPSAYGLEELLRQVRERPSGRPQLDLFQDNRLLHAEAKLRDALLGQRLAEAQAFLAQPPMPSASDATRAGWQSLIAAAQAHGGDPAQRLSALEGPLPALARRRLGAGASPYLRRLWQQLAADLDGQPFDTQNPQLHASYAWQRAREWARVCESVEATLGWAAQPMLVQRLIESHQHLGTSQTSRRLWLQFIWQHPDAAEAALNAERGDATLNAHWQTFLDAEPVLEVVDFPSWLLLTDRQSLPEPLPQDGPPVRLAIHAAMRALVDSHGAMDARRRLHDLHPGLLKHYLAARTTKSI